LWTFVVWRPKAEATSYIPNPGTAQIALCDATGEPMIRAVSSRVFVLAVAAAATFAAHASESDLSPNVRLLNAARNGDVAGVERCLEEGASADSRSRIGETALVMALKKKDDATARTMLAAGTDVNIAAVNGITALMAAAYNGDLEMVRQLLARGANVAATDRLGKNAMTYAAGQGHTAVVRALLAKGVDANAVYRNDLTALMWAAGYGRDETVKALLESGARTDLRDNRGKTAEDIAREGGYATTVSLLERGK